MSKYRQAPKIWKLEQLVEHCNHGGVSCGLPDGRWVPARPLGFDSLKERMRAAMLVFTGKADAVLWPGQ